MNKWRSINTHKAEVDEAMKGKNTIIVFDTETTGLEPDAHIIQFSGIKYDIGENYKLSPIGSINMYINPEMFLDSVITELTGITQETVDAALPERMVVREIMDFLNSADVWAGQNVGFDLLKVENMCKRCNFPYEEKPSVDTLKMARNLIPVEKTEGIAKKLGYSRGNHKLNTITTYLFPDYEAKYHDSLEDVRATALCLEEFLKMYDKVAPEKENLKQIQPTYAFFWQNPYKGTDQRLRVSIPNDTKKGDINSIYYDCLKHYWTSYSNADAKKLFDTIDMAYLEKCLLNKYSKECIEDLVRDMREKNKEWEKSKTKDSTKSITKTELEAKEKADSSAESDIDLW